MKKGTRALNQAPAKSGCCSWVSRPSLAWREPSGGLFLERTSDGRGQIPYMGPMWGRASEPLQPSRASVTPGTHFLVARPRSEACSKWTQGLGVKAGEAALALVGTCLLGRSSGTAGCQGHTCRLVLAWAPGEAGGLALTPWSRPHSVCGSAQAWGFQVTSDKRQTGPGVGAGGLPAGSPAVRALGWGVATRLKRPETQATAFWGFQSPKNDGHGHPDPLLGLQTCPPAPWGRGESSAGVGSEVGSWA